MNENLYDKGLFVISLDFELNWGVRDQQSLEVYGKNILGVREVVPALLKIFDRFDVRATWATVGLLFFGNQEEMLSNLPEVKPNYSNSILSPYLDILKVGKSEEDDPYHFGKSLITLILKYPKQELASHTFSHYYCLESGQTANDFKCDLNTAISVANRIGVHLRSIVFPRNQINNEYIPLCKQAGFTSYRGNEVSWIYNKKKEEEESMLKRGARLLDAYLNLSGHNCYELKNIATSFPYNIPASRFLRPVSNSFKIFEDLRVKRIKAAMTYAAKYKKVFHLWWHPHNFGGNLPDNMLFLDEILAHFKQLQNDYGMVSRSMGEIADFLIDQNNGKKDCYLSNC